MPDFERLTDSLREHFAAASGNPERIGFARGYKAGKKRARIEVLAVVVALYFFVAMVGKLASA